MNKDAWNPIKLAMAVGSLLILSGCVAYHQPRYGGDGVYFDQYHPQPQTVVVTDPFLYPFWSLDHFYFSSFHHGHRWGSPRRFGWGYPHFGYLHAYGYIDHGPLREDHLIDQRLIAIAARDRVRRAGSGRSYSRPVVATRLSQSALRTQRQNRAASSRSLRRQSSGRDTRRPVARESSRSRPAQRPATNRQTPRSRPPTSRAPSRATRSNGGSRHRSTRQIDPR